MVFIHSCFFSFFLLFFIIFACNRLIISLVSIFFSKIVGGKSRPMMLFHCINLNAILKTRNTERANLALVFVVVLESEGL